MDKTDFLYILDESHQVLKMPNHAKWMEWMGKAATSGADRVAFDRIESGQGTAFVVTTFMGIDLLNGKATPPNLFSTSVYMPFKDGYSIVGRYPTWEQAEEGHHRAMDTVRKELGNGSGEKGRAGHGIESPGRVGHAGKTQAV